MIEAGKKTSRPRLEIIRFFNYIFPGHTATLIPISNGYIWTYTDGDQGDMMKGGSSPPVTNWRAMMTDNGKLWSIRTQFNVCGGGPTFRKIFGNFGYLDRIKEASGVVIKSSVAGNCLFEGWRQWEGIWVLRYGGKKWPSVNQGVLVSSTRRYLSTSERQTTWYTG